MFQTVSLFAVSAKIYPFEFYENNELAGFDIELAKLIAKELKKEVIFKDMYYYNIFTSIQNNSVDVSISSHIFTQKRAKQFYFSKIYQQSRPTFIYNIKYNKFSSLQDLKNKKISPFYGSMFNNWFAKNIGDSIQKIYYNDELSASKALENGLVDAILLDKYEAFYLMRKNKNIKILDLDPKDSNFSIDENMQINTENSPTYLNETIDGLGFGIIIKKTNPDLLKKINNALEKLEKEGKIYELKKLTKLVGW